MLVFPTICLSTSLLAPITHPALPSRSKRSKPEKQKEQKISQTSLPYEIFLSSVKYGYFLELKQKEIRRGKVKKRREEEREEKQGKRRKQKKRQKKGREEKRREELIDLANRIKFQVVLNSSVIGQKRTNCLSHETSPKLTQ